MVPIFKKIESNLYIKSGHLKKVQGAIWDDDLTERTWAELIEVVSTGKGPSLDIDEDIRNRNRLSQEISSQGWHYEDCKNEIKSIFQSPLILIPTEREKLNLQDDLVKACKSGDEKTVGEILQKGAKVDSPNERGERPLAAAVWGMCPNVVSILLKQTNGIVPMTWKECEEHNLKHYNRLFITPWFIRTYTEWYLFLNGVKGVIDWNSFLFNAYLKHLPRNIKDWGEFKNYVYQAIWVEYRRGEFFTMEDKHIILTIEKEFSNYRTQIQKMLVPAPTVQPKLTFFNSERYNSSLSSSSSSSSLEQTSIQNLSKTLVAEAYSLTRKLKLPYNDPFNLEILTIEIKMGLNYELSNKETINELLNLIDKLKSVLEEQVNNSEKVTFGNFF